MHELLAEQGCGHQRRGHRHTRVCHERRVGSRTGRDTVEPFDALDEHRRKFREVTLDELFEHVNVGHAGSLRRSGRVACLAQIGIGVAVPRNEVGEDLSAADEVSRGLGDRPIQGACASSRIPNPA